LFVTGNANENFFLTVQPDRPDELERVESAGGRVINWNGYRVLGVLATSRSIGRMTSPFVLYVVHVSEDDNYHPSSQSFNCLTIAVALVRRNNEHNCMIVDHVITWIIVIFFETFIVIFSAMPCSVHPEP
jgi:hypothetical protein